MIPWILLVGLNIGTLLWALRLWWRVDEEKGLNDYLDETAQYWEDEARGWERLYHQVKRDTVDGDWWKE